MRLLLGGATISRDAFVISGEKMRGASHRSWTKQLVLVHIDVYVLQHHSNIVPWQLLAERTGCVLKFVGLSKDETLDMAQVSYASNACHDA